MALVSAEACQVHLEGERRLVGVLGDEGKVFDLFNVVYEEKDVCEVNWLKADGHCFEVWFPNPNGTLKKRLRSSRGSATQEWRTRATGTCIRTFCAARPR